MRKEIRYCGAGGQGVILLGIVTAHAAVIEGNYSSQGAVYGAQVRGGIAASEVVLSTEPVIFPYIEQSDMLLSLSQEAFDYYLAGAKRGSIIIIDSGLITVDDNVREKFKVYEKPFTRLSIKNFKTHTLANMIAFGFVAHFLKEFISERSALEAIERSVSKKFQKLDKEAFRLGLSLH